MSKAPSNFRKADIIRGFDAMRQAGIERPRLEIVLPNGSKLVFAEQPESSPTVLADEPPENIVL